MHGRTEAKSLVTRKDGVEVRTDRGVIRARNVVVATGYEAARFLSRSVAKLNSTYAMVTEPVKAFEGWPRRCLGLGVRPSIHLRAHDRGQSHHDWWRGRPFPRRVAAGCARVRKRRDIVAKVRRLFPRIKMEVAYTWAGTFGETVRRFAIYRDRVRAAPIACSIRSAMAATGFRSAPLRPSWRRRTCWAGRIVTRTLFHLTVEDRECFAELRNEE